jgi:hypothetical protein
MQDQKIQESISRHPTSYRRPFPDSPSLAFIEGWRSEPFYTDEEAAERAALMERDEQIDRGLYLVPDETEPDRWPTLTSRELAFEYPEEA